MSFSLSPYLKAITAGLGSGLGILQAALVNNPPGTSVTVGEWAYAAGTALVVGAATWGIPNALKDGTRVGVVAPAAPVAAPAVEAPAVAAPAAWTPPVADDGTRVG